MLAEQATSPQPTMEEQAAYFDKWNTLYRNKGFDEIEPESKTRGEKVLQLLHSLSVKQPTILEIGCGTGWLTEKLVPIGPTTAIDLSARAIEIARQRGLDATFIAGDFYKEAFPLRHFDVVVLVDTLSVVPDQPLFMEKLASLMKPGAFLILTSLNKFVYQRRSDIKWPRPPGEVCNWLSRRELHQLLKRDFRILTSDTVLPKGDRGLIMRIVNSHKVNWLLNRVFSTSTITRAKEKVGLGHCHVILAQRRGS